MLLESLRGAGTAASACIFEAAVLLDALSLRGDGSTPPLELQSESAFSASLDTGGRAHIALQYISVGLGANPQAAHKRLACDYGVAVVTSARAPHAQYPDAMGAWEPLTPDEIGGSEYSVHFKVGVYLALDTPAVGARVLHIRLNMHPALSRDCARATPEETKREAAAFELKQVKFMLSTAKTAALKTKLDAEMTKLLQETGDALSGKALQLAAARLLQRARKARVHDSLQAGLVNLPTNLSLSDTQSLRACCAVLLCLAYCPPMVDYCDLFNEAHRVPLVEETRTNHATAHLSRCKTDVTLAVARYVGLARPRAVARASTASRISAVTQAAWVFKNSEVAVSLDDREMYAAEPSLVQNMAWVEAPPSVPEADNEASACVFMDKLCSDQAFQDDDSPARWSPATPEMRALFCRHDERAAGTVSLQTLQQTLAAAAPGGGRARILVVYAAVAFAELNAPAPARGDLCYARACYELCACVLHVARTRPAAPNARAARVQPEHFNIPCICTTTKIRVWKTHKNGTNAWSELHTDNFVDPATPPDQDADAATVRHETSVLMYYNVFARAAADSGEAAAAARAPAALSSAALLADPSAHRALGALLLCVASAPPLAEFCGRHFENVKDARAIAHFQTFMHTATLVKSLRGDGTQALDCACLAGATLPTHSLALHWQALVAALAHKDGLRALCEYTATYTHTCPDCADSVLSVEEPRLVPMPPGTTADPSHASDRDIARAAAREAPSAWTQRDRKCSQCFTRVPAVLMRASLPRVLVLCDRSTLGFVLTERRLDTAPLRVPPGPDAAPHELTAAVFAPAAGDEAYRAWVAWGAPGEWRTPDDSQAGSFADVVKLAAGRPCVMLVYSQG